MHLVVAALLALATTSPGEVNVVSRVTVADDGPELRVTIEGARPLTFSTFSTQQPPGFVVDLPETSLQGVPEAQQPEGSVLREIRAEERPVDGLAQSRVSLAFGPDVEPPRVAADGNAIVITIAKPPAPVPVPAAPAPPAASAIAVAAAPAARVDEPAQEQQPAAAPGIDAAVTADPPEVLALATEPPIEELPADLFTSSPEPEPAAPPAPEERPTTPPPAPEVRPTPPAPVAEARPTAPAVPAKAAPIVLREVGFQLLPDGARVFVRMSGTPRFAVREPNAAVVLVELEETRAQRDNDLRPLDTSFFPTAVFRVTPRRQGTSTVLEIQLREPVAWRQQVTGDVLAIDFDPPAEPSSSPAPAEPSAPAALR